MPVVSGELVSEKARTLLPSRGWGTGAGAEPWVVRCPEQGEGGRIPSSVNAVTTHSLGVTWARWVSAKGRFLPLKGPIKNTTC